MKLKTTRRALFMSAMSLLLCFTMLLGTTFAWFTDSVSSMNNLITAGNLDVDVYYGNPADKNSINNISTLFNDVTLWEPGVVAYENLTVANLGTLALKYDMTVNFANENYVVDADGNTTEYSLSDVLKVGLVDDGVADGLEREDVIASVKSWVDMSDFETGGILGNELYPEGNEDSYPAQETLGIVVYWEPSEEDNNYNVNNKQTTSDGEPLYVDLGVTVVATQLTYEEDSFDENYDAEAKFPIVAGGVLEEGATEALTLTAGKVTVEVPAGAEAGNYVLTVTDYNVVQDEEGNTDITANITVTRDDETVNNDGINFTVTFDTDIMSDGHAITHNGVSIPTYNYDLYTGKLSFITTSFSPFAVSYDVFATEVALVDNRITHGFFEDGHNPVQYDNTLSGDTSEYIAVDFVKDGKTWYAVSERATTVFVSADETSTIKLANYETPFAVIPNASGKLWSIVTNNMSQNILGFVPETVYILPGTYNEEAVIYVRSDMEIMGLGDAEEIKIIKVKGSKSNRHVFNCRNDDDYIQVVIRNLYIDSTAKNKANDKTNLYLANNGAVQSISMAKVKCYDLVIKDNAAPFFVNSEDHPGAYMYVENCSISNLPNPMVDTASPYKFYYNNLTTSKGLYSEESADIKNTPMDWNDWEW